MNITQKMRINDAEKRYQKYTKDTVLNRSLSAEIAACQQHGKIVKVEEGHLLVHKVVNKQDRAERDKDETSFKIVKQYIL
jgi:hypothetical protein